MNFGQALENLKTGRRVSRVGWNGKGMWLAIQPVSQLGSTSSAVEALLVGNMTRPYIYMYTADEELVPWVASQTDMLAEDWTTEG